MKTSDIFKASYGVSLGFMCAKLTVQVGCRFIAKLCDVGISGIDKIEENKKKAYNKEKRYSLTESLDDGWVHVKCATAKDFKDLTKWFDSQLENYSYVSVNDLKEFVESGFSSFEYKDQGEGWTTRSYHIDRVTNTIIFDIPIDISDLVFDPDKDIEKEEDKEDEVEISE